MAYAWADLAALLQVYERLRDTLGVLPVKAVKHGPSLSIYYEDPDGNRSEFYVDVMSTDDAIAYMTTDIFVADPVGEGFDHQDFFARLARGEDVADRACVRRRSGHERRAHRGGDLALRGRERDPDPLPRGRGTARFC